MPDHPWLAWVMTAPGAALEHRALPPRPPGPDEVVVEVAGCGLCHTDLGFLQGGVKTRREPPLVLGHEISGVVRVVGPEADPGLLDRAVLVPAVLPCGTCPLCQAGRRTICRRQVMPGNDRDGGFASHVVVPARFLCPVPPELLDRHPLWELAVVSDAVATPFQAVRNSGLQAGDLAVFVGVGGIGVHGVQIAAAAGAKVVALDLDDRKLELARRAGAQAALNPRDVPLKELRRQITAQAEALGARPDGRKIFETSGTRAGQETAFALLGFGASLAVVGYTTDRVEICLSNLMAYDAVARGNWGADPLLYPEILDWVGAGRIRLEPFVERHPLDAIGELVEAAHQGRLTRRAVLVPATSGGPS